MRPVQHTLETPYMVGPVHCYTAQCGGELVLFDTGPPTVEAKRYLQQQVDLSQLRHVAVTHCHIDHYGLAAWLAKQCGAVVSLPYRDTLKITNHAERLNTLYDLLRQLGFDEDYLEGLGRVLGSGALFPPFPQEYRVAEEELPKLGIEVIPCPGHSQSDLVFAMDDWAVTGDTLLQSIFQSPLLDVDLQTGGRFRNYAAYCASLVKLAGLRNRTILPGHRQTVESVTATLLEYVGKMLQRVAQLLPFKDEQNVAAIVNHLFGMNSQEPFYLYLKGSEVVFMQDFLHDPQLLRTALEQAALFDPVARQFHHVTAGC